MSERVADVCDMCSNCEATRHTEEGIQFCDSIVCYMDVLGSGWKPIHEQNSRRWWEDEKNWCEECGVERKWAGSLLCRTCTDAWVTDEWSEWGQYDDYPPTSYAPVPDDIELIPVVRA